MTVKTWRVRLDGAVPRSTRLVIEARRDQNPNECRIAIYAVGGYAPAMPSFMPDVARKIADRVMRAAAWVESRPRRSIRYRLGQ